jgi:hypothetical protein
MSMDAMVTVFERTETGK